MQIHVAATSEDFDRIVVVKAATARAGESPTDVQFMRDALAIAPDLRLFVALVDGETAGCGSAGAWVPGDPGDHAPADATVLPAFRRRGVGTALLRAASAHARALGKVGLTVEVREDEEESLAFLLRRSFAEIERQKAVALQLAAVDPLPTPPPGVTILNRSEELVRGMYETAIEAGRDIPGLDAEHEPTYAEWRSFEVDRPSRDPRLAFVALADGEVVGFASADVVGETGYNGLTAVRRSHRRRGVARALKEHQIAAAKALGLTALVTESEERNVPMRRLNESLGYRPIPGSIVLRGPLLLG